MNTAQNQRHMETERKLREALLFYMKRDTEPTVDQLCRHAKINRSTFYRHYAGVYDLMEQMEREFQHGLFQSIHGRDPFLSRLATDADALVPLIDYIGKNPHFYRLYLKGNMDIPLSGQFQRYWQDQIEPIFRSHGVEQESTMRYYYAYFKSGLQTVLRLWLENGCIESPEEISRIISRMLPSILKK